MQTGHVTTGSDGVRTRLWRDGRLEVEDFPLEDISEHLQDEGALVWLDLCEPDHNLLKKLAGELALDPHAVEDAIAAGERPKATRHATHTVVTVYATRLETSESPHLGALQSRLRISRVSAFVLPRGIVTVRFDTGFDMDQVVQRWEDDADLLKLGSGALLQEAHGVGRHHRPTHSGDGLVRPDLRPGREQRRDHRAGGLALCCLPPPQLALGVLGRSRQVRSRTGGTSAMCFLEVPCPSHQVSASFWGWTMATGHLALCITP